MNRIRLIPLVLEIIRYINHPVEKKIVVNGFTYVVKLRSFTTFYVNFAKYRVASPTKNILWCIMINILMSNRVVVLWGHIFRAKKAHRKSTCVPPPIFTRVPQYLCLGKKRSNFCSTNGTPKKIVLAKKMCPVCPIRQNKAIRRTFQRNVHWTLKRPSDGMGNVTKTKDLL